MADGKGEGSKRNAAMDLSIYRLGLQVRQGEDWG